MRGQQRHELIVALAAALFLITHLALARTSLEDIDSINFALSLQHYDIAQHQPHPPGYPVFVAIGRAVAAAVWLLGAPGQSPEALSLVIVSVLSGAAAVLVSRAVLLAIGMSAWAAAVGALLFAVAPLTWITAARPLSDMAGLTGALLSQLLVLRASGMRGPHPQGSTVGVRSWQSAALAGMCVGLSLGIRSQVLWLTLPLAGIGALGLLRRGAVRHAVALVAGVAGGALLWLVPMIAMTGGVERYLAVLADQAGEDLVGVPMLALQMNARRLLMVLGDSLVQPWGVIPLAILVGTAAALGTVRLLLQRRRVLLLMALLWAPYALFHGLFQETETTRYALPLVLPLCALSAVALEIAGGKVGRTLSAGVAAVLLVAMATVSLRAHWQYHVEPEGVFDVLEALREDLRRDPQDGLLMHRRVWAETRRARGIVAPLPVDLLQAPRSHEWLGMVPLLERGDVRVTWLVDPRRGDRVAVDPRSQTLHRHIGWEAPASTLLGGMRPHPFDWYSVRNPWWVLRPGWALTPELAGLSRADQQGPSSATGAQAAVRAGPEARTLLLGGRHLAAGSGDPITLAVTVGADWRADFVVMPGDFHRVWTLPAGVGSGIGSETLTVRTSSPEAAAIHGESVALEQFDIQPVGVPVAALAGGWFEPERDVDTGRSWRWMAERARVDVWGAGCDLRVTLEGTWPRHYPERPVLTVHTGGRNLYRGPVARPFSVAMTLPADLQTEGAASLELSVSQSFVAGERTGTADARRLALELATVRVEPASGDRSCKAHVDSATHESVRFRRNVTRGSEGRRDR